MSLFVLQSVTHNGRTALHEAAESGHAEVVRLLLSAGANPYAQDKVLLLDFPFLDFLRGLLLSALQIIAFRVLIHIYTRRRSVIELLWPCAIKGICFETQGRSCS